MLLDYGITGIAVSFLIFAVTQVVLWARLAKREINMKWSDIVRAIIPGAISSIVMYSIVISLSLTVLESHTIANMLYLILIGALSYLVCIFFDRSEIATELKENILKDIMGVLSAVGKSRH